MYVENRTKIERKSPIFPPPVYLTPPMKGFPMEFGIGVRGPKCLDDGPTRWSKKFSDRFSRFDTIPAVTDTQPASHVAVAITLNAKASSLIKTYTSAVYSEMDLKRQQTCWTRFFNTTLTTESIGWLAVTAGGCTVGSAFTWFTVSATNT